jgi:hypothetical protein
VEQTADGTLVLKPVGSCDPATVFGAANVKKRQAEDADDSWAAKRTKTSWADNFNTRQAISSVYKQLMLFLPSAHIIDQFFLF